jgi:N-acyl-D-aspartate/D-glutamate deacylase
MGDLLITNGTVVDGTGAAQYRADVRIRDGVIVEIAPGLAEQGERVIDAAGAVVTPGFVETHTHYDLEMFWDPSLDPLPLYGVTTMVMGNCGLGIAPVDEAARGAVADLLCYIEELPVGLSGQVPWSWESWSEYRAAAGEVPLTVTPFAYVSHNALRVHVMGAAGWTDAATPEQRAQLAAELADAIAHGCLGLSSNLFDNGRQGQPVPSRAADDEEFAALFEVLAAHPHTQLQIITLRNRERGHRLLHLAAERAPGMRAFVATMPEDEIEVEGIDVWTSAGGALQSRLSFGFDENASTPGMPAWHRLINRTPEAEKPALLADPEWRARARHDWDHPVAGESNAFRPEVIHRMWLEEAPDGPGPTGVRLVDRAAELGEHPSDVLADWVIANGLTARTAQAPDDAELRRQEAMVRDNIDNPRAIAGLTDAGAHLHMFCGAGTNLHAITYWHRDAGVLTLEQAVQRMTASNAEFFGLRDRGTLEVGKRGDVAVFAVDEVQLRPAERRHDILGDWRFTRPSAGFRATVVAGVPTVLDGEATGARPARFGSAVEAAGVPA